MFLNAREDNYVNLKQRIYSVLYYVLRRCVMYGRNVLNIDVSYM